MKKHNKKNPVTFLEIGVTTIKTDHQSLHQDN